MLINVMLLEQFVIGIFLKGYLHASHTKSSFHISRHSKWYLFRNSQSFSFLEANVVVNMNNLGNRKIIEHLKYVTVLISFYKWKISKKEIFQSVTKDIINYIRHQTKKQQSKQKNLQEQDCVLELIRST